MKTVAPSERGGGLGRKLVANMERMTRDRIGALCLENVARNRPYFAHGHSLARLRQEAVGEGDAAIVVAAGPSIKRHDPIRAIKAADFKGALVVTESAIYYCLRNGVVPDLVVTVDPAPIRIIRWFGDPGLTPDALAADDYYRRQDMDDSFARELGANAHVLELMDRHAKGMKIALSTASSEAVVKRVLEAGMTPYWWNPMLDDPDAKGSVTRRIQADNGFPSVNAGGNIGTACWVMADAVLGKRHVALTGVDFSYYDDTPLSATQYYPDAVALVGEENLDSLYIRIHNPHTGTWFYTDPAYMWYREVFLEMAADAECATYNCTGGGILFGDNVEFVALEWFLERHGR